MAKCKKCGRGIGLFRKAVLLNDNDSICEACYRELGFDPKTDFSQGLRFCEIKDGKSAYIERRNARMSAHYDFNVHWDDERTDKILERYQKDWTDREDRYEGMTKREFKECGGPGDKVFKYPPLDVDVELSRGEIDGKAAVLVSLIDGGKNPLIGYAPKTKAKKILQLIDEHNESIRISAELSGGDFWELVVFHDGEAVCESNIPKPLKVQVRLDWSSEIK